MDLTERELREEEAALLFGRIGRETPQGRSTTPGGGGRVTPLSRAPTPSGRVTPSGGRVTLGGNVTPSGGRVTPSGGRVTPGGRRVSVPVNARRVFDMWRKQAAV